VLKTAVYPRVVMEIGSSMTLTPKPDPIFGYEKMRQCVGQRSSTGAMEATFLLPHHQPDGI
jgi:hypothetical protein